MDHADIDHTGLTGAGGSVATDAIWDAAGDLAVGSGANTAAKLTVGASGKVPASNGTTLAYVFPPGYEFDYVEKTSIATITASSEGTADTVVASNSVAYDGSTVVYIEVYFSQVYGPANDGGDLNIVLLEDSTVLGRLEVIRSNSANRAVTALFARRKRTPSNASHTYTVKAYASASSGVGGGAGGSGNEVPGYIRVVKA